MLDLCYLQLQFTQSKRGSDHHDGINNHAKVRQIFAISSSSSRSGIMYAAGS